VQRGKEEIVKEIFEKWDLPYAQIGDVTDDGMMRVLNHGHLEVEIPADKLANDAPVYRREAVAAEKQKELVITDVAEVDPKESLLRLLAHPTIASKNWVYRQYDYTVRAGTVVPPGSDAAVFYVREAGKFLGATTDCNGLYCQLDPREGARIAVAEAARNLACSGATPLAVTDNLNFGNPYRPENFWQLREAVEGLADACRRFGTPVTGGNVSLYNENPEGAIDPTPTVGMVGLIEREEWITRQYFRDAGDRVLLLGPIGSEMGASHYLSVVHERKEGRPPRLNFDLELNVQRTLLDMIRRGYIKSAHDCSEGGLAVALAEACISGEERLGASIWIDSTGLGTDQVLFNESQSRVVATVGKEHLSEVEQVLAEAGTPFRWVGEVGGDVLSIAISDNVFEWGIADLHDSWYFSIERMMAW